MLCPDQIQTLPAVYAFSFDAKLGAFHKNLVLSRKKEGLNTAMILFTTSSNSHYESSFKLQKNV